MPRHSCQTGFCHPEKKKRHWRRDEEPHNELSSSPTDSESTFVLESTHHTQTWMQWPLWARFHFHLSQHRPLPQQHLSQQTSLPSRDATVTPLQAAAATVCTVTFIGNDIWPDITWLLIVQNTQRKASASCCLDKPRIQREQRFRYLLHWLPL